jgi:hypothetical protein
MRKIFGSINALAAMSWHFILKSIDAWFFDKVVHQMTPFESLAFEYGPIIVFASLAIYLLGHGVWWGKNISTNKALKSSPDAANWRPMYKAVEHVADVTDDTGVESFDATRKLLRQAASDGRITIRGRKEVSLPGTSTPTLFSTLETNIPKEYWVNSVIAPLATDSLNTDSDHTMPETVYAWGPNGIFEKNRYASLRVDWAEILKLWPRQS